MLNKSYNFIHLMKNLKEIQMKKYVQEEKPNF